MKNPLTKRIFKNLLRDWAKNLMIMLLMIAVIGAISGMYVANHSMLETFRQTEEKYKLEDGHFELSEEASSETIEKIEIGDLSDFNLDEDEDDPYVEREVTLYENYYKEATEYIRKDAEGSSVEKEKIGTIRLFKNREDLNLAALNQGRLPKTDGEIAIDRMHADNIGVSIGDEIYVGQESFEIVGLIALPDYQVLLENTTDIMFDALSFNVAVVTEEGFDRVDQSTHYNYAWIYTTEAGNGERFAITDDKTANEYSQDFVTSVHLNTMMEGISIEEYVPEYASTAIHFAEDDMGSDKAMGGVLLYIFIAIFAFIFAVSSVNMIEKDAAVIGTLRASGYTKSELVRHYMATPIITVLIAAMVGNVLGYTFFKDVVVGMYYNSYSLPPYVTVMSTEALWKTTLVPIAIMIVVNYFIIRRSLSATPLQFLRSDFHKRRRKKAIQLPKKWKFITRFRLRVLFQNVSGYGILFAGILFIMIMLAMAVGMPEVLARYQEKATEMVLAKNQMILKSYQDETGAIIETDTEGAEKYAMTELLYEGPEKGEEISIYGLQEDSEYLTIASSLRKNELSISIPFAEKYDISEGDVIELKEEYGDEVYKFQVVEINSYEGSLAGFMDLSTYEELFDLEENAFTGYLSDEEITDIDSKWIAKTITSEDISKLAKQLDHSMGDYMKYFQYILIIVSFIMITLLTKLIIEKNENAISMTKIFGYRLGEIGKLYLLPTTLVVLISSIIASSIGTFLMDYIWKMMMLGMNGYYRFDISMTGQIRMILLVCVSYLLVLIFDFIRIRQVPMDVALKNVE